MADAAAKESSMEDILSSIRKIISEDDSIKPTGTGEANAAEPEPVETTPVNVEVETAPVNVEAEVEPALAPATPAENKSLSLEDIAANIKAGVLTTQAEVESVPQASESQTPEPQLEEKVEEPVQSSADSGMKLSEIVAKMSAFKGENEEAKQAPAEAASHPSEPVQTTPVVVQADPEPAAAVVPEPAPTPVVVEAAPQTQETEEFRTALMSPSSNAAVTDSLERLKRSAMDDMDAKTESILRPMLREWLDENLPTMVERLVREEIERVSRGV